jgi:hypothetical protein
MAHALQGDLIARKTSADLPDHELIPLTAGQTRRLLITRGPAPVNVCGQFSLVPLAQVAQARRSRYRR